MGSDDNESHQFYKLILYVVLCRNFTLGFWKIFDNLGLRIEILELDLIQGT